MIGTVAGLVLIAIGLAIGWLGSRPLHAVPRLLATEIRNPRTLRATGEYAACKGTANAVGETIEAPFTGTDCLVLQYEVTERQPFGIALPWIDAPLEEGIGTTEFDLVCNRGTIRVDPTPSRFTLEVPRDVVTFGTDGGPPDRIRQFLEARNVTAEPEWLRSLPGFGRRRFVERRVDPGEEYVVLGRIERRDGTVALGGDIVIGNGDLSDVVTARLRSTVVPILVSLSFLIAGGWLLLV